MWKKIISKILTYSFIDYSINEYCQMYVQLVSEYGYQLLSLEKTQQKIPEELKSLNYIFNEGKLCEIMSFFYYFHDLTGKHDFDYSINQTDLEKYSTLLNDSHKNYIYKKINFEPDILLSSDNPQNFLAFLFLYFLPSSVPNTLLFHPLKKIPLITFNSITNTAFDMLLYLMELLEPVEFQLFCKNYNLNCMLIEDYMSNIKNFYTVKNLDLTLPVYKIHKLLEKGCTLKNIINLREQKILFNTPNLGAHLAYIEKHYYFEKLNNKLTHKNNINNKIIKI